MKKLNKWLILVVAIAVMALPNVGFASDIGSHDPKVLAGLYPGKGYSPYAQRSFPDKVYWGDTHLQSTGLPVKIGRSLDWLVITDHTDMMGFGTDLKRGAPNILAVPKGREWVEGLQKGGDAAAAAALDLITTFSQLKVPKQLVMDYSPGSPIFEGVWESIVDAAEKYNEPGRFTAFIGYEWTSVPQGNNLHRNVIYRDGGDRARQMLPMVTIQPFGSTDPLDLYKWMDNYEAKTGGKVFTLAHNGNLSNGWMFPVDKTYAGGKVDKNYVEQRAKREPLYEITQIKGDGEAHPFLSPDDEFADYETWDAGNLDLSESKKNSMLQYEYAREALKQGLALEKKLGTNPYKFGFSGATDSHTSLSTAEEDNFFGKSAAAEPSKNRVNHPFAKTDKGVFEGYEMASSGYTGVWAAENTRESLWDAMVRREVYTTTGPRLTVRFFGGWEYTDNDLRSRAPAFVGYKKGVPMGGDLQKATSEAPTFMVYALRDPIGANLDRIQIIKGWMDKNGETHEKVYNVAWSNNRSDGAPDRKLTNDGKLPAIGNTVDLEAATWLNTIGGSELGTVWTDPDFDKEEKAFYYARVLEIPTPRWILYDKVRLGAEIPKEAKLVDQERAYTSPIWYTP
jgi:hypothetical protein